MRCLSWPIRSSLVGSQSYYKIAEIYTFFFGLGVAGFQVPTIYLFIFSNESQQFNTKEVSLQSDMSEHTDFIPHGTQGPPQLSSHEWSGLSNQCHIWNQAPF